MSYFGKGQADAEEAVRLDPGQPKYRCRRGVSGQGGGLGLGWLWVGLGWGECRTLVTQSVGDLGVHECVCGWG